jgi:hypothetical protein
MVKMVHRCRFLATWWRLFCRAHYLSVPDDGYFVVYTIWAYLMTGILSCTLFWAYLMTVILSCTLFWAYLMTVIFPCTLFERTWRRLFCRAHYLSVLDDGYVVVHTILSVPDDGYFVVHTIWAYLMTVILSFTLFERTWWRLFCHAHYLSVPDDGYFVVHTKLDIYVFIIITRSIPLLVG